MVKHVLFDGDGVIQDMPVPWEDALRPYVGERAREFLLETWEDERPMLAGDGEYMPVLAATLAKYGVELTVEEVYAAVWLRLEVVAESVALVRSLRKAGYGVHLATNQVKDRAAYMRQVLGYDDLFDVSCYSCELGVTKPDREFFRRALDQIGAHASEVLFIDDAMRNVEAAREAGLCAERWHFGDGRQVLCSLIANHGLTLDLAPEASRKQ
jgi:putative hydrolase of the HAD superfamily